MTETTPLATPPVAAKKPHSFSHHGVTVSDDYAWLRDPGYPVVNDPEILAYLEAENAWFEARMAPHQPLAPWRSRLAPVVEARRTTHLKTAVRLAGRLFAEKPKVAKVLKANVLPIMIRVTWAEATMFMWRHVKRWKSWMPTSWK